MLLKTAPPSTARAAYSAAGMRRDRQRGFTLVETVIAAGLLGFLAVTATYFWVDSFTLVRTVNSDSTAIAEARGALERAAREIREVKYSSDSAAYCISTLGATQIVFNKHHTSGAEVPSCGGAAPTNADNDIAITLQISGSNLNLSQAGTLASPATTKALCGDVSSFGLRYLDAASAVTASASAVRFVELSLTVQPSGVQATQLRTLVALRNN